jgi:glycosyltransferase involved in cell wall biosynthesis
MKIAFLAGKNSIHTIKWIEALAERNHQVYLITQHFGSHPIHPDVTVYHLPCTSSLGYFLNINALKKILRQISPDFLNVHYASGYGTLGRLSAFHPLVLSVWGSDVFDFPQKSFLHKEIIAANLCSADWVCSTSKIMAEQVKSISDIKNLSVTPFGIDVEKFKALRKPLKNSDTITIGTVKSLTPKYGIDTLIRAFAQTKEYFDVKSPLIAQKLRLLIVGDGVQRNDLESLVEQLELQSITTFTGSVPHTEVPSYLNQLDIYVALSRCSESFGVAVLEASACEIPVIVSNKGGLPEVVENGVSGYVVETENIDATAQAIVNLVENESIRRGMGKAGRKRVLEQYEWSQSVDLMEDVYKQVLQLD